MRSAAEIDLLRRITRRLDAKIEAERPKWEALVRAEHAGDPRMAELAVEVMDEELRAMPEQILDEVLVAESLKIKERLH